MQMRIIHSNESQHNRKSYKTESRLGHHTAVDNKHCNVYISYYKNIIKMNLQEIG